MARCDICGKKIEELFLGKIKGTYTKKEGKLKTICFECQKKFKTKEDILKHLK
jgi:ribosome-binding protein aMBF1 (putative translation factor)